MRVSLLLSLLLIAAATPAAADTSDTLEVAVDHARILKIPQAAETIIIGNPSIVDVTVHDAETLVLTGRSYGVTNVVVIGAGGNVVFDDSVIVTSFEDHSVRIYRQAARTTYACAPQCEPKVVIGDEVGAFAQAAGQFAAREGMIKTDN